MIALLSPLNLFSGLFLSHRKFLRISYETEPSGGCAASRTEHYEVSLGKSGAAKAIDCGVCEAHFCSYICNGKKTWIILFVEIF